MGGYGVIKKVNIYHLLAFLFIFFSFSTLTYQFWPIINRIVGFLIIGAILIIYILKIKIKDLFFVSIVLLLDIISFFNVIDIAQNINDALYFTITLLVLWKLKDNVFNKKIYNAILDLKIIYKLIIIIDLALVFVGFFLDGCYEKSWEGNYYLCFGYSQHSFCCACCILMAISFFWIKDLKNDFIKVGLLIVPTYGILQSGARTYIISIIIFWALLYFRFLSNKLLKRIMLPIVAIIVVYIFLQSNMFEKMTYTFNNRWTSADSLVSFTSGRIEFWAIDFNDWLESTILQQLFGKGFDYVYQLNYEQYGIYIWAHNDFINVLLCNGLFGILIYSYTIFSIYPNMSKRVGHPKAITIIAFLILVALLNGLFVYQHYLYSFVLLYVFFINDEKSCKKEILAENNMKIKYANREVIL